ncbi:phosphate regulon sensor histidine kinase PhoR [Moritella marina ATCC 15381]|uniref:Phosphate regulon sensor protein PhoR n=1 Tax=Moritella marina ATCC 15381 TaxID=1202962 RepID=A0A5J6WER5_MORMI|nr:phosphate regulon sensor histidine kinase PhoR [Moritella marina]QFI36407.1 phosphate regulon sensor histidine kinase PhoR [Moritella marina ATCC 15381]
MNKTNVFLSGLWRLLYWYIPFFLVGLIIDDITLSLLIAAGINVIALYRNQYVLHKWLWVGRSATPPEGKGSWESIFNGIYSLQRRHKRKRKELRVVIRRFREGAEALPDAVVALDTDYSIMWCNKLAQQMIGLKWPEDANQHIGNLIRTPDFIQYLNSKDYQEPLEITSPTHNSKTLEIRIMTYTDDQSMLVARDVTELRQLEQVRRNFMGNVSHELRTPLTVLKGYLEMLEPDESDKMFLRAHKVMSEQTARMDSLVNQLLALSRIEAAQAVDFEKQVDIPFMLSMLEQEVLILGADKALNVTFTIEHGLFAMGDESQLRSAVSNLIYNAVRYTPEKGDVIVEWKKTAAGGSFSVKDNGDGISAEHLHHLTERFYRVDDARSRDSGGSGIGLSIVKHVLTNHDCLLNIDSKVNKGSCFSFTLPQVTTVKRH